MSKGSSLVILSALALLSACGGDTSGNTVAADVKGAEKPDVDSFLAVNRMLVAHNCSNCHAADYPRVGPSMRDVAVVSAQGGAAERQRLKEVILNGGKGRWGMAIMPAQKQVNAEQASALVDEIMKLKDVKAP